MKPQVILVSEKVENVLKTEGVQKLLKLIAEDGTNEKAKETLQAMVDKFDLAIMRKDKTKIQGVKCTLWVVTLVSEQIHDIQ